MNYAQLLVFILLLGLNSSTRADAAKERIQLLEAMQTAEISLFQELLAKGVDPNISTSHEWFRFTSSCESTKKGNTEYFEAIVESGAPLDLVSPLGGFSGSMIACAIYYDNFEIYIRLQELGVDINAVQNPEVRDTRLYTTPFHVAVMANRFRIAYDILKKINPSDSQIRTLRRVINQTPGYEGHKEQPFKDMLVDWLQDKGYEINEVKPTR